jgi:PAS domain-containing protein
VLLPVVVAGGWVGGRWAGVLVGAAIVPLRLAVWAMLGLQPWSDMLGAPLLVGTVALAALGGAVGWLRDLTIAARHAEAEIEALLDAVDESIIRYGQDGRMRWVNRRGRQRFLEYWGRVPTSVADVRATVGATEPTPSEHALAGEVSTGEYAFTSADGALRRFSVRAVPIRHPSGRPDGVVAVWHDVTELHEAIATLAQYDGAAKTVRRVLHEMGNALAPAMGYADLLGRASPAQAEEFVGEIRGSVARATEVLDQLGAVVRFAETEFGGEVMLDLEAAAEAESNGQVSESAGT